MREQQLEAILDRCQYQGWKFILMHKGADPYLQCQFEAPDSQDTETCALTKTWITRKWPLSYWMTESEVVATVFKAVLTAIEHEAREFFKYKDMPVFNPHIDVNALMRVCAIVDVRKA